MEFQELYDLYRKQPPVRGRGASHVAAYWDGFDGRPCKFVRTSYGRAAWLAGRDNAKAAKKLSVEHSSRSASR